MESLRLEIQHDMKTMKTDIEEVKRSVNRLWEEIEEMESLMSKQREDVDVMKAEILLLKGQVKKERVEIRDWSSILVEKILDC